MPRDDGDWAKETGDPRSFLQAWCAAAADALNAQLSGGGRFVAEVDCRTREAVDAVVTSKVLPAGPPSLTVPARFTDRFGVSVLDPLAGRRLLAVVLFATPDNKADSDGALAFAVRAASLMSAGVGVVIVDALTGPPGWATHLQSLTGVFPATRRPRGGESPVLVVHPEMRDGAEQFHVWHHGVAPGFPFPTVPVPARGASGLTLDLEATYTIACRHRLPG
jgi:hypothetical protein